MPEPFRPDDELVSAVLDGEATVEERARVAADPVLSARLAEFAATAERVGGPVAPPAGEDRDHAIRVALRQRRRPDVVVALGPRRESRSFLAVAAAVLVVLLAAGFLAGRLGGGEDRADEVAGDSGADAREESGGAVAADEPAAEGSTDDTAAAFEDSAPLELGAVADETALRAALVASGRLEELDATPTTRSTLPAVAEVPEDQADVPGDSEDCLIRLEEADPALDGVLVEGIATYAGTRSVVYVFAVVDGDRRVVVVSADACRTLVTFPL